MLGLNKSKGGRLEVINERGKLDSEKHCRRYTADIFGVAKTSERCDWLSAERSHAHTSVTLEEPSGRA